MQLSEIAFHRLRQQRISQPEFSSPAEVARWLGAMQGQDYTGVKWALGLRMAAATDSAIEAAFNHGEFLRTHLMRPTWHIVARDDIRWMLALTAPRVQSGNAYRYTQLGLDRSTLVRTADIFTRALEGGQLRTRDQLRENLELAGVSTEGQRMPYILMHAELEGLICSGGRSGKQFTYGLIVERAPAAKTLLREEALIELTRRYFTSHGPATARDFTWWSGLTQADMKTGLAALGNALASEKIDGQTYWFAPLESVHREPAPTVHLLPPYDEYTIAYQNHAPTLAPHFLQGAQRDLFGGTIVIDGQVTGYWRRTLQKTVAILQLDPFRPLASNETEAARIAAQRWGAFLGLDVAM